LEALKMMANIDIVHVPYRGGAPALNDLLAGQVDLAAAGFAISLPHITAGKLKILGVTSQTRLSVLPHVPTLTEAVPGLDADALVAIAAPSGTSKDITGNLSQTVAKIVATPDVKARFSALEIEPLGTTPEQMRDMIDRATEQWGRVIAAAKISLD
jgi:tripartite-type tricarboxylate transporter receptor subunit TctC